MKLLNVIQRYPPAIGGSELWCQGVSRFLAERGHDVRVLTLDVDREEEYWKDPLEAPRTLALGRLALDEDVVVRRFRRSLPVYWIYHSLYKVLLDRLLGVYFYGPHSAEMYGNLRREMRRADAVLLHTWPHPHNLVAFAAAKSLRKPTIAIPYFHPDHPFYERKSNYWVLRHCDLVVVLTEHEAEHLRSRGVRAERIHVAGIGIRPEEYRPVDLAGFRTTLATRYGVAPEDRIVTFLGRKIPEKGVDHLLAAARDLIREQPLRFFLVGPRFDWYDALYASVDERDRARIIDTGSLPHQDKVNLLHASDLLVLPSQHESFGLVFLEAWLCGAAVLGTTQGAMPGVIDGDGYLARYGDAGDLKTKIREALADPERSRLMTSRGRERVLERFTWEAVGSGVEKKVREAVARRGVKPRVILCSNAYPPRAIGGAELIAHEQAKSLQADGYDVRVFAGEHDSGLARHSLRADRYEGVPIERVTLHDRDYSWEFFNFVHRPVEEHFERSLDRFAPEIVHFHNLIGLSAGMLRAAKRRRAKVVVTLHDYWGFCFKNTLLKRPDSVCEDVTRCAECLSFVSAPPWRNVPISVRKDYMADALDAVDVFMAPSEHLAARYAAAGIPAERIRHVPYGIDASRLASRRSVDHSRVRFVFAGYLGRHKGVDVLLEALSHSEDRERMFLHLAGSGERREEYERRVKETNVERQVRFWGSLDHRRMARVYRHSDVLVLPSIWPENQPVSILEAMALGMPVIASRIGGIPEIVEDGHTGYLVEPGDAKDLGRRMSELANDPEKRAELGENARKAVATRSLSRQLDLIRSAYQAAGENPASGEAAWHVACAGTTFDTECTRAIRSLEGEEGLPIRFFLTNWLADAELRRARALWVVDRMATTADVSIGLRNALPLLVPAENPSLRALCVAHRCGLYYGSSSEAVACLRYWQKNPEVREAMGRNALRMFYSERSFQTDAGAAVE